MSTFIFQPFDIGNILQSPANPLQLNQSFTRHRRNRPMFPLDGFTVLPNLPCGVCDQQEVCGEKNFRFRVNLGDASNLNCPIVKMQRLALNVAATRQAAARSSAKTMTSMSTVPRGKPWIVMAQPPQTA